MPGPSNKKKSKPRRRIQIDNKPCSNEQKSKNNVRGIPPDDTSSSPPSSQSPSLHPLTPTPPMPCPEDQVSKQLVHWEDILPSLTSEKRRPDSRQPEWALSDGILEPPKPFIYDPGNGPRVRDTRAFLSSKYFAEKPAMHVPLCAEFSQPEILEMLRTILPEEMALTLWYNKSRSTSRICPACQRLYRLGDNLPDLASEEPLQISSKQKHDSPYLYSEQEISGLCSPICFILASFNYPGAIKQAWGRMVDDIDDQTWKMMNEHWEGNNNTSVLGKALSMLVKMTRLHDLGLSQLCFGHESELASQLEDSVLRSSLDFLQEQTIIADQIGQDHAIHHV